MVNNGIFVKNVVEKHTVFMGTTSPIVRIVKNHKKAKQMKRAKAR